MAVMLNEIPIQELGTLLLLPTSAGPTVVAGVLVTDPEVIPFLAVIPVRRETATDYRLVAPRLAPLLAAALPRYLGALRLPHHPGPAAPLPDHWVEAQGNQLTLDVQGTPLDLIHSGEQISARFHDEVISLAWSYRQPVPGLVDRQELTLNMRHEGHRALNTFLGHLDAAFRGQDSPALPALHLWQTMLARLDTLRAARQRQEVCQASRRLKQAQDRYVTLFGVPGGA